MIVCGLHLNPGERADLIRRCAGFHIEDSTAPGVLARGDVCLPDLPETALIDLPAWGLPVMIWAGADANSPELRSRLFAAGIAALWIPSGPAGNIAPLLAPPTPAKARAALVLSDRNLTTLLRQIFLFAGIESRSDFHSSGDFAALLPSLREGDLSEMHVVLDLSRPDFLSALHALGKETGGKNAAPVRLWALRDFSAPGPDPALIQRHLAPFTSRIFEPVEALVALVEALFLFDPDLEHFRAKAEPLQMFDGFRDAERLLRGRSVQLLQPDPRLLWVATMAFLEKQKRALPFHWLYDVYEERRRGGGVVLAAADHPEPRID